MSSAGVTEKNGWQFERRVPLMLLVVLAVQIGTALIWAGAVSERIGRLEMTATVQGDIAERLTRQEEKLRHALEALGRIEQKLERIESGGKGK